MPYSDQMKTDQMRGASGKHGEINSYSQNVSRKTFQAEAT
jgi:hypothetical protein